MQPFYYYDLLTLQIHPLPAIRVHEYVMCVPILTLTAIRVHICVICVPIFTLTVSTSRNQIGLITFFFC